MPWIILVELKQLGELKDKSFIRDSSFLRGCLVVHFEASQYLLFGYATSPQSLIWVGLSSNQTQNQGLSWWCFTLMFRWSRFPCHWSHRYACPVHTTYESSSWSILISLLTSPSIAFSFLHVWKDSIRTVDSNVGNLSEPSSCHHVVRVLYVWERSSLVHVQWFTYVAMGPSEVLFVSPGIITSWSRVCSLLLRW